MTNPMTAAQDRLAGAAADFDDSAGSVTKPRSSSLNIWHLKLFESAARVQGVAQAARECHLSQPAVTYAIAKLEEQLTVKLLMRRANGRYLNQFGAILYRRAQRFFAQMERALVELGVPRSAEAIQLLAGRIAVSQMRSLIAVVDQGTFTQAARALGTSQSMQQRNARDLEQRLRTPLYVQTAQGTRATAAACDFARKLKVAQREIDCALEEIEAAQGHLDGEIVIGALLLSGNALLASVIADLVATYPHAHIRISSGNTGDVLRYLHGGEVDVVIGLLRDPGCDDLVHEVLAQTPFVAVVRQGHPLARRKRVTLDDLAAAEWVIGTPGSSRRCHFDQMFATRPRPIARIVTGSLPIVRSALLSSDRITLLTSYELLQEQNELVALPTDSLGPAPAIGLTTRENWLPTELQANVVSHLKTRIVEALIPYKKFMKAAGKVQSSQAMTARDRDVNSVLL